MNTENSPKMWFGPNTGTSPIEMRLWELSHPWMWIPASYSELVWTPGSCLMKLTGSVLPRIFGRDWMRSVLISVAPEAVFLIADVCLCIENVVLSRCRYKESVCAPAFMPVRHKSAKDANSFRMLCSLRNNTTSIRTLRQEKIPPAKFPPFPVSGDRILYHMLLQILQRFR